MIAEDADHAAELRRVLERPFGSPRISVMTGECRHAA
jgi:hypothetical protein